MFYNCNTRNVKLWINGIGKYLHWLKEMHTWFLYLNGTSIIIYLCFIYKILTVFLRVLHINLFISNKWKTLTHSENIYPISPA